MSKDIIKHDSKENDNWYLPWYWYTAEEKSVFAKINRKQEDKDVDTFQKTRDASLFEKIYEARIPTLQIWARRYQYLTYSKEDMFGEFCLCFTKAILTYQKKKGYAFNTYLFRLLINCAQNLQTGRRAKKRLPIGVDPNAMGRAVLSLDYSYDGKDGSENTLKDIIANKMASEDKIIDNMITDETLNTLSGKDLTIKGFLKKLSDGNTIASLIKEYKTKRGKIKISKMQAKRLNGKKAVSKLIKRNIPIREDFMVLDYSVSNLNKLYYTIRLKKTDASDLVMRTIRRLRKDKQDILSQINS